MKKIAVLLAFVLLLAQMPCALAQEDNAEAMMNCFYDNTDIGTTPSTPGRYINQGCISGVEAYPSDEKRSLKIQTQKGATQWFLDISFERDDVKQAVIEAEFAYTGAINSSKRIFTCLDKVFFTMNTSGVISLFDGTKIATLQPGVFTKLTLIIDMEGEVFSVKVNDRTVVLEQKLETTAESVKSARIQFYNITGDEENFYLRYYRGYEGVTQKTTAEINSASASKPGDTSVAKAPVKTEVTEELINRTMAGNTMIYTRSPKARIGRETVWLKEGDESVMPETAGSSLMLPDEFLARALSLDLQEESGTSLFAGENTTVSLTEGSCEMKCRSANGEETLTLADAPVTKNGLLYVPLRAVCEVFGKQVHWDRCGIIFFGDTAEEISWTDEADFKIIVQEMRDIVYYQSVTPEEIISALKEKNPNQAHPRLLVTRDSVDELRDKVKNEEPYKSWFETVKEKADSYLAMTDEQLQVHYVLEDGIRLLYVSRRAQEYITNLAFTYLMTGDKTYSDGALRIMNMVCDFPDWHPYHFLDVSEMAAGVALGYDWCYDALTVSERAKIRDTLVNYALKPVMEDYNEVEGRSRTWYWSSKSSDSYPQNWVSINFGGTTLAALAVGDEDLGGFTEAGNVITEGFERMKDWMEKYMPDGVCVDGGLYWLLAMNYMAFGINGLETAVGEDYKIANSPGFQSTFEWLSKLCGHAGVFNVAGAPEDFANSADSPEFLWWAQKSGNTAYNDFRIEKALGEWGFTPTYKDIIWYKKSDAEADANLSLDYENRNNNGFFTMAAGNDTMDTWMGMFVGTIDKTDSSCTDQEGTFAIDMLGERWATIFYQEPLVYSSATTYRGDYYRYRAEGQNTVVIQPGYGRFYNPNYCGEMLCRESNGLSSFGVYDFTNLLAFKGADKWHRGAYLDRENQTVVIQDELTAAKAIEYYWFMHTQADIEISEDGQSAVLSKNDKQIQVNLISRRGDVRFEIMEAVPLGTSPSPNQADNTASGYKKLAVHVEKTRNVDMAVEFVPLYGAEEAEIAGSFTYMADWSLKEGAEINADLTLDSLRIDGAEVDGFEPYKTDYSADIGLEKTHIPVIEGTSSKGDVTVINPDEDNLIGKVIVTDRENPQIYNEYILMFHTYPFGEAADTFTTPKLYATGEPANLKKLEPVSVTASDIPQEQNAPENVLDGNYDTRYSVNVLGAKLTFELQKEETVNYIGVVCTNGTSRSELYVVAASEDGESWEKLLEVKSSGTTKDMEVYELPETKAKYMRIYCCGNSNDGSADGAWHSLAEVSFFSK